MTMEVLGATKHGGYKESLEFSSCPELPIISSEDDVLIEIAHTDVNPVGFAEVARQQRGGPGHPVVANNVQASGGEWYHARDGLFLRPVRMEGMAGVLPCQSDASGRSHATHVLVDRRCVVLLPSSSGVTPARRGIRSGWRD